MEENVPKFPQNWCQHVIGCVRGVRGETLEHDPFSGAVFAFRNRRGTALKVLIWDGQGFWLCHKRLSEVRFYWWARSPAAGSDGWPRTSHLFCAVNPDRTAAAPDWRRVGPHC